MENVVEGYAQKDPEDSCLDCESQLETAEARLAEAELELGKAQREIVAANRDIKEAIHPHQFKVTVIYNGVPKEFEVRRDELVQRLLDQARQAFGAIQNPHLLGLFTREGIELKDNQSSSEAGLKPCETLLLRPSTVRGG